MSPKTLEAIATILGNGYTCFVHREREEVFSAADLTLEEQKSAEYKCFIPLESKVMFNMMEAYTASIEDFEQQSALMEALTFEQPFSNFKKKVYQFHLADGWIAYRTQKIIETLQSQLD